MFGEKNSAAEIFEAAAQRGKLSRRELSAITGYSLMTVGKAVDALDKGGLLSQEKHSNGSVGRSMNLCAVNEDRGMLIYDFSSAKPRIAVFDMRMNVKGEIISEAEDFDSVMAEGFGCFLEFSGGELVGMGCIAPEGREAEFAERIGKTMGNPPDISVCSKLASAAALIGEVRPSGAAVMARSVNGAYDLTLWSGGFVRGAHGRAASAMTVGEDELAEKLADYCMIADPETVHIASVNGAAVTEKIRTLLTERGVAQSELPRLLWANPESDGSVLLGAAVMLRHEAVSKIAAKNS